MTALSDLSLRFSPGTRWEYGVSTDVLGRLVEVIDGKTLGEALSARIFQPLGMVDTGFQVPGDKLGRAAQPGSRPNGQPMTPRFAVNDGARYQSGGGGLTATMDDYLRFTAMLANHGELAGKRVLGKQTVAFMTADHTGTRPGRPPGLGFGLGFEVRTRTGDSALPGSVGEYGWAGNAGTLFWIDPKEQLTAIYMVQVSDPDRIALPTSSEPWCRPRSLTRRAPSQEEEPSCSVVHSSPRPGCCWPGPRPRSSRRSRLR